MNDEIFAKAVHLRRLEVEGIRRFRRLGLGFEIPADPLRGQIIVLAGDNGRGKTTLLEAMAIALHGKEEPRGFPRLVGEGRERASISLVLEDLSDFRVLLHRMRGGYESHHASGASRRAVPCAMLFNDQRRHFVCHIEGEGVGALCLFSEAAMIRGALLTLEKALAPVFDRGPVSIGRGGITLDGVRAEDAGDGARMLAGWLLPFIARWLWAASRGRAELSVKPDFHLRMPGVCIVDAFAMHLHPRRRARLIGALREAFPMTTFVLSAATAEGLEADGLQIVPLDSA